MGKSSVRSRTPEKVPVDPPSFGRADKTNRESDNRTSILFHSLFMQTRASDILVLLTFHSDSYSPAVADILALDGRGARPMELFPRRCESETVRRQLLKADARELFPGARDPEADNKRKKSAQSQRLDYKRWFIRDSKWKRHNVRL